MSIFEKIDFSDHESVHFIADRHSGLRAIIAIHSTALGPAAGGCRYWRYSSSDAALTDALRLSRGMSFKNALANLPVGGGKAVILQATDRGPAPDALAAFGRSVESLGGRYITAEDVGTRVADMKHIGQYTRFVSGLRSSEQVAGGDPSPRTALGVYLSMKEAWRFVAGTDALKGVRIGVQGCGGVGEALCRLLHTEGAVLFIADVSEARSRHVEKEFKATRVLPDALLTSDVDILAPCAMGGVLTPAVVAHLRARIVCGAANNQLATDAEGEALRARGIVYAPDYIVNAGGIISVTLEYFKSGSERDVRARIEEIPLTLRRILDLSEAEGCASNAVADRLARERIANAAPAAREFH